MGRARLSAVVDSRDRNAVAYHEGGHAITALFTPGAAPIYKATIVPRGQALGLVREGGREGILTTIEVTQVREECDCLLSDHHTGGTAS
jgi:ATP-dependent Zn protease